MADVLKSWKAGAKELRAKDPRLAPIIDRVGPPEIRFESNHFKALCESILSQQLATTAAAAILNRFKDLSRPFPSPDYVRRCSVPRLRKVGISGQKAAYLKALSARWGESAWRRGWAKLDNEALVQRLVEVHGIGVWTAHMFLIFALGRTDVLPVGDYGVRRAIGLLMGLDDIPAPKALPELVSHWKGQESIGSWYLWRALDQKWFSNKN
ncbi:MAG: DNA-3-methyladenine glycosylase 2 family protein [Bdellovibrionaceae bacterium]|nr:DNA-3-methyladenine glycosylase 2 family protein [Bdellovibrionales bacterium]MCB9253922.1 DNA-3-methyladenine glycosylase 2 family protein [Pseudobdellovibrionaceae bacterium]